MRKDAELPFGIELRLFVLSKRIINQQALKMPKMVSEFLNSLNTMVTGQSIRMTFFLNPLSVFSMSADSVLGSYH